MQNRRALITWLLWGGVLVVSAAWMVVYFLYVEQTLGWESAVATLLPHEVAVLVLGLVLPPLLLVTLIAAFRGQMAVHLKEEMIERLPQILEEGRQHTESVVGRALEQLEARTGQMREALDRTGDRLDAVASRLGAQAGDLQGLSEQIDRLKQERAALESSVGARVGELGDLDARTAALRKLVEEAGEAGRSSIAGFDEASRGISASLGEAIAAARGEIETAAQKLREAVRQEFAGLSDIPDRFGVRLKDAGEAARQRLDAEVGEFDRIVAAAVDRTGEAAGKLKGVLHDEIAAIDAAVAAAAEHTGQAAGTVRGALRDEIDGLDQALTAVVEQTARATDRLKTAIQQEAAMLNGAVESAADHSRQASERLKGAMDNHVAALDTAAAAALERSGRFAQQMRQSLAAELEKLGGSAEAVASALEQRLAGLSLAFGDRLSAYHDGVDGLVDKAAAVAAEFDRHSRSVSDVAETAMHHASELGEVFDRQTASLSGAATRAEAAAATVRSVMEKQAVSLEAALAASSQRIEDINDRMHERVRLLGVAADAAGNKVTAAGESFRHEVVALADASARTLDRFADLSKSLGEHSGELHAHAGRMQQMVGALSGDLARLEQQLENQGSGIGDLAERLLTRIEAVNSELAEHTHQLSLAASTAVERSAQVGETMREQGDAMQRSVEHLMDRAPALGALLQTQTRTLIDDTSMAVSRIGEISDMFQQQKEAMDLAWSNALNGLTTLSGDISKELSSLSSASDEAAQRLTEMGDAFAARTRQINLAVETASSQAEEVGTALSDRMEKWIGRLRGALEQADSVVDRMHDQATALGEATGRAAEQVAQIRNTEVDALRDNFLRSATEIMAQLNSSSIDLSRLLQNGIPAEAWARYQAGDRGFFTRRLLKIKDEGAIPTVRAKYHAEPDFRAHVDRFLRQFDKLGEKAVEIDPDKVFYQALMTADVGKLYILLNEALGRRH